MWCETDDDLANVNFKATNIDKGVLKTLSRDDLKDLFPGPENFLKRKKLWDVIGLKVNVHIQSKIANVIDKIKSVPII